MKGKASWFCVMMAAAFVFMMFVEHAVFKDPFGVVVCFVGANIFACTSFILLKQDEILDIRLIECDILRSISKKKMERAGRR